MHTCMYKSTCVFSVFGQQFNQIWNITWSMCFWFLLYSLLGCYVKAIMPGILIGESLIWDCCQNTPGMPVLCDTRHILRVVSNSSLTVLLFKVSELSVSLTKVFWPAHLTLVDCPNVDNPNSWIILSPMQITLLSLSPVLICLF